MRRDLLDDARLEASWQVANNSMNRERGLRGENSYTQELGFDPLGHGFDLGLAGFA